MDEVVIMVPWRRPRRPLDCWWRSPKRLIGRPKLAASSGQTNQPNSRPSSMWALIHINFRGSAASSSSGLVQTKSRAGAGCPAGSTMARPTGAQRYGIRRGRTWASRPTRPDSVLPRSGQACLRRQVGRGWAERQRSSALQCDGRSAQAGCGYLGAIQNSHL